MMGCSTFTVPGSGLVGHNLDMPYHIPGIVLVNPRGVARHSVSFNEFISGKPDANRLEWESLFGSITLNVWGEHFADGGINEAGLTIHEMTLEPTVYPPPKGRPTLFMPLWMQSVLDRFETVAEVIDDLERIAIDGWAWHYFLTDRTGDRAILEFHDGIMHVYRGESMPHPILCNTSYAVTLHAIAAAGDVTPDPQGARYLHGAYLVDRMSPASTVDDAFNVLKSLERNATEWSWVIDTVTKAVYLRTKVAPATKTLRMDDVDLSSGASTLGLDAHEQIEGDIAGSLAPVDTHTNEQLLKEVYTALDHDGVFSRLADEHGQTVEALIGRMRRYPAVRDPRPAGAAGSSR